MKRLYGKVAMISGGGSWIGKEIAKLFARHGARIFIFGRHIQALEQTVAEIIALGGEAACVTADISSEKDVKNAVKQALKYYGNIDIIVQNAAVYPSFPIEHMSVDQWKQVIDINLTGSFLFLKSVIEQMKKQRYGKIIFMSATAGEKVGLPGFSSYTASKAGINGLMRTAALEFAKYNITVNSIEPGNIINRERFKVREADMRVMLNAIPMGRIGQPKDVATMALFLASEESGFVTGQNFVVDGGELVAG